MDGAVITLSFPAKSGQRALIRIEDEELAAVIDELRGSGLAYQLMDRADFVVPPLPNLLFTRDSSVWVRDHVALTSLAMPARNRETQLTGLVYSRHPRFREVAAIPSARTPWIAMPLSAPWTRLRPRASSAT